MPHDIDWGALAAPVRGPIASVSAWLAAALVLAAGAIHLHLWDIAYRHVSTLGPLFLVQAGLCLILAVAVAVTRRVGFLVITIVVMLGTMVGLLIASTTGLFGFNLHHLTVWAYLSLLSEGGAVLFLGLSLYATTTPTDHGRRRGGPATQPHRVVS
jgi:hypothetical protein